MASELTGWTARRRVRAIPIANYVEMLKVRYMPSDGKKYVTARLHIRKIARFLLENPSVKTTADLTETLITDYAACFADRNEKNRNVALVYLRRAFNLAVEWNCLKRNPFEEFPLPKRLPPPPIEAQPTGKKLDADQVRTLLAHLKSGAITWNEHRLHTLISMVAYTGLLPCEHLRLTVPDCRDGLIRRKQGRWARRKPIPIGPSLKRDLDAWLLIRKLKKRDRSGDTPYGKNLGGDGKTLIIDENQHTVITYMSRWRCEKNWSYQQIADELNARGIPTKYGKGKWQHASVRMILRKTGRLDSDRVVIADESQSKEGGGTEAGPDWVFPNVSGKGHWSGGTGTGRTALEKLRRAGEEVGIEGLTFVLLARSHLIDDSTNLDIAIGTAHTKAITLSLSSAPVVDDRPRESSPWDGWSEDICPMQVSDGGEVTIFGRPKKPLRSHRDRTALRLFAEFIAAYPFGFKVPYLEGRYGDPRGIIHRYRQSDADYLAVLQKPGKKGQGLYGIGRRMITKEYQPSTQTK